MMLPSGERLIVEEHPAHLPERARRLASLSELEPGTYVDTVVRVTLIRSREKADELGQRPYIFGIAEDSTSRVPFICYKPYQMFFKNSVFMFENAYVRELNDHSLILILTEHSRIRYIPEEPAEKYFWQPKIGSIRRPLGFCRVTLEGTVSKIHCGSGLVKRCDECGRIIHYGNSCGNCGGSWHWTVRVSCRLSDETGGIDAIFPQYLACRMLDRPISEILYAANKPENAGCEYPNTIVCRVKPPDKLEIVEATTIDTAIFRQSRKLIVVDSKHPKIYYIEGAQPASKYILDFKERFLNYSNEADREILARILEKALDLEIRRHTGLPKIHGIYLTEEPLKLRWTEAAKLYLGFELYVSTLSDHIQVEFYPNSLVRESVLEYIRWRRERGASAETIKKAIIRRGRSVILAPNGTLGTIKRIIFEDAGSFKIPTLNVSLPDFWRDTYDINVDKNEKPLLVVQPYNLDIELTYPPSCVYFDEHVLSVGMPTISFLRYKRLELTRSVFKLASSVIRNLRIGSWRIEETGPAGMLADVKRAILHDIRNKLLGKTIKATGSVVQANGRLYFIAKSIEGVN